MGTLVARIEAGSADAGAVPAASMKDSGPPVEAKGSHPKTPAEALGALEEGNLRHQRGEVTLRDHSPVGEERAERQEPFAAVVACADSRVSPTLIFDLEPGNLFVSRVAGNGIDAGTLGTTEYAVEVLGVKLVVVLGHSDCGAVKAAIEVANGEAAYPPDRYGAIGSVVAACVPPIEAIPAAERSLERSVEANARAQADSLAGTGPIIKPALDAGGLRVVAAVYDIATRRVTLL